MKGLILQKNNSYRQFAVRNDKKSPNQETGSENWGPLKDFNDTKLILND